MIRTRPTPPLAPLVLLDDVTHDPRAAVVSRLGATAYTAPPPGPDGVTPPAKLRPEFARPTQALQPAQLAPQARQRLKALLAKVDERTRKAYAEAVLAYRAADALFTNRREVASDFSSYGVTGGAALLELREATEAHRAAERQLWVACKALHAAVLVEAERERVAAVTEAEQRLRLLQDAQQDHAAAVRAAESAASLGTLLRDRPKAALEAALAEEIR